MLVRGRTQTEPSALRRLAADTICRRNNRRNDFQRWTKDWRPTRGHKCHENTRDGSESSSSTIPLSHSLRKIVKQYAHQPLARGKGKMERGIGGEEFEEKT